MQVDPIKPKLNPPGTKRLNLDCDKWLSNIAFNFNLRRYIMDIGNMGDALGALRALGVDETTDSAAAFAASAPKTTTSTASAGAAAQAAAAAGAASRPSEAGAYTRPLFSST